VYSRTTPFGFIFVPVLALRYLFFSLPEGRGIGIISGPYYSGGSMAEDYSLNLKKKVPLYTRCPMIDPYLDSNGKYIEGGGAGNGGVFGYVPSLPLRKGSMEHFEKHFEKLKKNWEEYRKSKGGQENK
jgi:hypothetical protein